MQNIWLWVAFGVIVSTALIIDLAVFHRRPHALSLREALAWCVVWVSLAVVFSAAVFATKGTEKGLEFVTGYIIEWSLSVDNLFVFLVIFSYFAVPQAYQHRVLFWGIMGAAERQRVPRRPGANRCKPFTTTAGAPLGERPRPWTWGVAQAAVRS